MGSFQASVSAAWAVDASSRPASNSITCRVRTEFSLFPDVDRHGSATGRPPDGPEVMPAPRVWPRDHRSPKLSRPPSPAAHDRTAPRSEEHTSELQSLMRISYAVFCFKNK